MSRKGRLYLYSYFYFTLWFSRDADADSVCYSFPKKTTTNKHFLITFKKKKSGSYKRLSTNSILPSTTKEKIKSQLSRRINQEIILLSERIKSQSKNYFEERIQEFRMRECII